MKWPKKLVLIRHAQSAYNALREKKEADLDYQRFKVLFKDDPTSEETRALALLIKDKFSLGVGDYETPLTDEGKNQAHATGETIAGLIEPPDIVLFSPYLRTRETLGFMGDRWTLLKGVLRVPDDRIREQEHGLALLYNDSKVFQAVHPDQRELKTLLGSYWYQFPQGESVSQVRDRVRDFLGMLIREHSGKNVMVVTHHLTILSIRATLERLTPEEFLELDRFEKPVNCGVTVYSGNPNEGRDGRLILDKYNQKLY